MPDSPRFQYSLKSLLLLMSVFAIVCSALATFPEEVRAFNEKFLRPFMHSLATRLEFVLVIVVLLFGVVVAIDVGTWPKTGDADSESFGKKLLSIICLRRVWIGTTLLSPLIFSLSFLRYYLTYGASGTDGVEEMGWPLAFFARGGITGFERWSWLYLFFDVLAAIASAFIVTIALRNGPRPILAIVSRLFHLMRTWPNENETSQQDQTDQRPDK
jgi:hypothetical protein